MLGTGSHITISQRRNRKIVRRIWPRARSKTSRGNTKFQISISSIQDACGRMWVPKGLGRLTSVALVVAAHVASFLYLSHVVYSCALPHIPAIMCCLSTGPKQPTETSKFQTCKPKYALSLYKLIIQGILLQCWEAD